MMYAVGIFLMGVFMLLRLLTDHNHFEILGQEEVKKMVSVNPKNFAATVDGKPVATYLFYDGQSINLPDSPPSKSESRGNPSDISE